MHEYGLERPEARTGWLSRPTAARPTRRRRKLFRRVRTSSLNLALQGGGAHGAFTWGVLDRLLEAERFRHEGISGTSAGAIYAVVVASGWPRGRRGLARGSRGSGSLRREDGPEHGPLSRLTDVSRAVEGRI